MSVQLLKRDEYIPDELQRKLRLVEPHRDIKKVIRDCFAYLPSDLAAELVERLAGCVIMESSLAVVHIHGLQSNTPGRRDDYGIVSRKVVTTAGVVSLAASFNSLTVANFNFHGLGTGSTAEAIGDTALVTELTTQYNPDSTRATGSKSNPGSTNTYQTVATNTVDASATVAEHGIFSASSSGTLWDRSLTGTQTLSSGDGLQTTYLLTLTAGG